MWRSETKSELLAMRGSDLMQPAWIGPHVFRCLTGTSRGLQPQSLPMPHNKLINSDD